MATKRRKTTDPRPVVHRKDAPGPLPDANTRNCDESGARKHTDEALQMERNQLLSIFDSIDEPIYVSDPVTYEILFVNQTLKKLLRKEPVGGLCYREFQGLESPCPFCTNDLILQCRPETYRWEFENPALGRVFSLHDQIIRWPDGRDVRLELAVDITERKRAEKALRESEDMYRTLFNRSVRRDLSA